jgi:hypothetical protein
MPNRPRRPFADFLRSLASRRDSLGAAAVSVTALLGTDPSIGEEGGLAAAQRPRRRGPTGPTGATGATGRPGPRGARGPISPTGPAGPTGAAFTGPTGPRGILGVPLFRATQAALATGIGNIVAAACLPGERLTGGGYSVSAAGVVVRSSLPQDLGFGQHRWLVIYDNPSALVGTVDVYAVCVPG